ncbi:hypothetical protein ACEPAI_1459 [Sanghuangporus weigelae]
MWPFSSSYPVASCGSLADEYDYIIIGGGTSGCVLANRLSSDRNVSVLLVERGPVADTWISRVPLFSSDFASNGSRTYKRESTSQTALSGRKLELFSGKVLGGSSRINAMLYTRGAAAEYMAWDAAGRRGWDYDDVLPLFKRSERCLDARSGGERGTAGEWTTRTHDEIHFSLTSNVLRAAESLGLPVIDDINSSSSPALGISKAQFTINEYGRRHSTLAAFLPAKLALTRKLNLTICTETIATKLDIKPTSSDLLQVYGAFLQPINGRTTKYVSAKREVILCCGPLGNPQILLLSGIGPKDHLESFGIPVLKHLPGVGSYLQDHLAVPTVYYVPVKDSLVVLEARPLVFIKNFIRYVFRGTGLLLAPVVESMIFAKDDLLDEESNFLASASQLNARDVANIPNIEIMPIAWDASGAPFDKSKGAFSLMNVLLRPYSKGTVRLTTSDPRDPISCDPNVLSDSRDWSVLRASLRLSMRLAGQLRKDGYPMSDSRVPASDSDADLDQFIIEWARTTYHYSSTCRMAPEDDEYPGVVSDELCVHGVQKLRIADSSVFPQIIATHLQAPSVMVAERCSELLKTGN